MVRVNIGVGLLGCLRSYFREKEGNRRDDMCGLWNGY